MRLDDERDFEWLFRARYAAVARTVFLIVRNRAAAEDITSDAFVKTYEKWDRIGSFERPEAWVRKVAVRMAIRHVGRERSRVSKERLTVTDVAPALPDPDLDQALATLSPMQRAAVVLFYFEDRPVAEVAQILQVSESTIKQHLMRSRARLADSLREEAPDGIH